MLIRQQKERRLSVFYLAFYRSTSKSAMDHEVLEAHPEVIWFEQQVEKRRSKRDSAEQKNVFRVPTDPMFK